MKNWKKQLLCTLALGSCAFFLSPCLEAEAAYSLSDEVKTATPALMTASQIGVLSHVNPDLSNLPNKDAIVVMSFGTTYTDTRAKTITATVKEIEAQHPGVKVVTAFTSHIIIDRIKQNEGIHYPTPEEALEMLKKEGYTRIALTSLNIIPGMEYDYNVAVFHNYKNEFKKMTLGTPLIYWQGQEEQRDDVTDTMQAISAQFPKMGKDEAILLMYHGTPHPANAYYSVIQARLAEMGLDNVYVYTVEGWPSLETIVPKLKAKGISQVTLMPMMMVAGDHANNDMAGDEPDSQKSILMDEGFKVKTYVHGLGENQAVRDLFSARAEESWQALQGE